VNAHAEAGELVVSGDPGLVFGLKSVCGVLGEGELDFGDEFCGVFHEDILGVDLPRVNPKVCTKERNGVPWRADGGKAWRLNYYIISFLLDKYPLYGQACRR